MQGHHLEHCHTFQSPLDPTVYLYGGLPPHHQHTLMYPPGYLETIHASGNPNGTPILQQSHSTSLTHFKNGVKGLMAIKKIPSAAEMIEYQIPVTTPKQGDMGSASKAQAGCVSMVRNTSGNSYMVSPSQMLLHKQQNNFTATTPKGQNQSSNALSHFK